MCGAAARRVQDLRKLGPDPAKRGVEVAGDGGALGGSSARELRCKPARPAVGEEPGSGREGSGKA